MSDQMDDLAKALAAGTSRRSALRALLSGMFGFGAATLLPRSARAQQHNPDVAACIQQCCSGLTGMARAMCNVRCTMGFNGNCYSIG
ncbi:hypothetical protein tb265_04900 [Gemmatimonadetes bacterium T265]|nr:hypothetical protein tb265_04900 [Gemmatimonadetes bacterium T265]